jgi:hypothetical protein
MADGNDLDIERVRKWWSSEQQPVAYYRESMRELAVGTKKWRGAFDPTPQFKSYRA